MSLERVAASVREALDSTAPSDAEILRRVRHSRALRAPRARAKPAIASPVLGVWAAGAALVCAGVWAGLRLAAPAGDAAISREVLAVPTRATPPSRAEERSAPEAVAIVPSASAERPRSELAPSKDKPRRAPATPAVSSAPSVNPSWEDVARALREGDDARARALMASLRQSSDAATRDNARLAEIQLSVGAAGREAEPTPSELEELRALKERGATSSIRASARRLLEQVEKSKK